jgi:DNA-binding response OmpR family regulator
MAPPEEVIHVLAVCSAPDEARFFDHFSTHTRWRIDRVASCAEAADCLPTSEAGVILCAARLPDGTWKDVVSEARASRDQPRVIVVAGTADDHLWSEVLDLGVYDLLLKPLNRQEVVRVVSLAWRQWRDAGQKSRAV